MCDNDNGKFNKEGKPMHQIQNVKSMEQAEKIAAAMGGTLIALNGTTAMIAGGDISKLAI